MKFLMVFMSLLVLGISFNMYRFGYGIEDAFFRTVLFPCEGTIWAKYFSESAFEKVKVGMEKSSVVGLLGEPLMKNKDCSKICFWRYTKQDTGTADFDQRWVIFSPNKKVVEIRKSFFID